MFWQGLCFTLMEVVAAFFVRWKGLHLSKMDIALDLFGQRRGGLGWALLCQGRGVMALFWLRWRYHGLCSAKAKMARALIIEDGGGRISN